MSTAAALLDFTLDTVAEFVEPAPFLLIGAALDIVEEGWDRGEEALGEFLVEQHGVMKAELAAEYQAKIAKMQAEFDKRVEEIKRETDAACASRDASSAAKLEELNKKFLQVVEAAEAKVAELEAEIERLTAELDESRK